ncbi:hypothetical protein J4207_00975 [Candidatus Woesearchaeota archaeon]|nr:hypothetical protein [Candidatus Woesearchaeota archaeon]
MRWLLLLLLIGCTQQEPFINVGVLLDNDAALSGMELAVEEINQRDFLDSPLRLVVKDCTSAGALELIVAYGARVIIDACTEDVATQVARQNRVAVISLYHSGISLMPSVVSLDKAAARALVQQGYKKIGVLHSRDVDVFVREANALGGETILEYVERNSSHATQQRARLLASQPDALFFVDVNESAMKSFVTIPIFSYIVSEHVNVVRPVATDVFSAYFQKVYGKQVTYDAALGYDAIKAVAEALQKVPHSGTAIEDELQRMSFEGASGNVDFSGNRTIQVAFEINESFR